MHRLLGFFHSLQNTGIEVFDLDFVFFDGLLQFFDLDVEFGDFGVEIRDLRFDPVQLTGILHRQCLSGRKVAFRFFDLVLDVGDVAVEGLEVFRTLLHVIGIDFAIVRKFVFCPYKRDP